MTIRKSYITTLLATGAAAFAIAAAPTAMAASTLLQSCSVTGTGSECQAAFTAVAMAVAIDRGF